jgi:hypothetical protein
MVPHQVMFPLTCVFWEMKWVLNETRAKSLKLKRALRKDQKTDEHQSYRDQQTVMDMAKKRN